MREEIKIIAEVIKACGQCVARVDELVRQNSEDIRQIALELQNFPANTMPLWEKLADHGWYLNWHTPLEILSQGDAAQRDLNTFMVRHLSKDFDLLTDKLCELYPERKHILKAAFDLHQEENYIASIPLFFSQLDGICSQELHASYFEKKESLQANVDEIKSGDTSLIYDLNLDVLKIRTQFQAGSSSASAAKKSKAPSRNGILHGSRKHLDYGTIENSFKTFSLLCFIACCFDKTG